KSARTACTPIPISTSSSPTRPERTFRVRLQKQRRSLAVFPLRLPSARSSVSRLDKTHDTPRSRKSRASRAREGNATGRATGGGQDFAAPGSRGGSLLERGRTAPRWGG